MAYIPSSEQIAILTATLPTLPEGLAYELCDHSKDVVYIVCTTAGGGAVSIHLKRRTWASGYCIPNPSVRESNAKSGRGWKVALVEEAIESLLIPF